MKKAFSLVITGIVAGAGFATAFPYHAAGAVKAAPKQIAIADIRKDDEVRALANKGMIVRAAVPCIDSGGHMAVTTPMCLVFQDP